MIDYKLSEIKAICKKHDKCEDCEFSVEWIRPRDGKIIYDCSVTLDSQPYNWQIDKEAKDENKYNLPCKPNDTVWIIIKPNEEPFIAECKVKSIQIHDEGLYLYLDGDRFYGLVHKDSFGDLVFFNKEEAERKLQLKKQLLEETK